MKNYNLRKCLKLVALAAALPFIYGCGTGAGIGSLVGFLFGGGGTEIALLGGGGLPSVLGLGGEGAGVASLVNPEPASMLLVGSGLMAMSYFKSKTNRKNK